MSTLGDFCGTTLGDFVGSALGDRGCEREPEACGCSFLPHTFSVELSGISGFLVYYEGGEPSDTIEPFDLSVCNQSYSVSVPAWSEPLCLSAGTSPIIGPLLWYGDTYVRYYLQLSYYATPDGNKIRAVLDIGFSPYYSQHNSIAWSITLPWTDADCCDGIGRSLAMTAAFPIGPCGGYPSCIALSPGTGDGSICTITS